MVEVGIILAEMLSPARTPPLVPRRGPARLRMAEWLVDACQWRIVEQWRQVETLAGDGWDTALAEDLLRDLLAILAELEADRDKARTARGLRSAA